MKVIFLILISVIAWAQPAATLFCGFESATMPCTTGPALTGNIYLDSSGIIGNALLICGRGASGCTGTTTATINFPAGRVLPMERGTIAFWFKPNAQLGASPTGFADDYHIPTVGPYIELAFDATKHAVLMYYYATNAHNIGYLYGTVTTGTQTFTTGTWYYIVFSWIGPTWKIYVDGVLVNAQTIDSPFPDFPDATEIRLGDYEYTENVSIDEFQVANFPWTQTEVTAAYNSGAGQSFPLSPISTHGVSVSAVWSAGYGQVAYFADSGNDNLGSVTSYTITAYQGSTPIGSVTDSYIVNGRAEGLLQLTTVPMTTGTYTITAVANSGLGNATSVPYSFTSPPSSYAPTPVTWLGNSYGVDDSVPWPWTNVTTTGTGGLQIGVYGRNYDVSTGFGLPQQIISQGTKLLASPVSLSLVQSGNPLTISVTSNEITSTANNIVTWQGVGTTTNGAGGNQLTATVKGSVEYDGYAKISVTLAPVSAAVTLSKMTLDITVPASVAKYTYLRTDTNLYANNVLYEVTPSSFGEYINNLSSNFTRQPDYNRQWGDIDLGNDFIGLHVGHFDMTGWNVNEANYWQHMLVNSNSTVTYEALIANQSTTISQPATFAFYLMAYPLKPRTSRLSTAGAYGGTRAPLSPLELKWGFSVGNSWTNFQLGPTSLSTLLNDYTTPNRNNPGSMYSKLIMPFTNAHVSIDTTGIFTGSSSPSVCDTEDAYPEYGYYYTTPSRCNSDFWAANLNRDINDPTTHNVIDGYYIDESYDFFPGAQLTQGGFRRATGNHGYGTRTWEVRLRFERLYKLLLEAGKEPLVYLHSTPMFSPLIQSHALAGLMNENCCSDDPSSYGGTDHFNALNASGSFQNPAEFGNSIGAHQWIVTRLGRLGIQTNSWRGLNNGAYMDMRQQQAECILQMEDVTQQDQYLDWWQIKSDWGIDQPQVSFNPMLTQTAISSSDPNVEISYYQNERKLLAYAANFGSTQSRPTITINPTALGWLSVVSATQNVLDTVCSTAIGGCNWFSGSNNATGCVSAYGSGGNNPAGCDTTYHATRLSITGGDQIGLTIPGHQCAVFTLTGSWHRDELEGVFPREP